jgi:ribosomal protein L11 methyltransferase
LTTTSGAWIELSITVDGEMAEAVSEVLARFIPNGVAIESTAVSANADDSEGHAIGPLRVYGFLRIHDQDNENDPPGLRHQHEATRQQIEEALWYLGRIRPLPPLQFRIVQEDDWAEAWKQHYHPIFIGKKLVIVPAWLPNPTPDRVEIRMDPGMAFGTGTHPTTQLCLEYVEEILKPGDPVIDIGCGSGILSVAALKLGASGALGVDIDPDSVRVSHENAILNDVKEHFEIGSGSVFEIRNGQYTFQNAPLVLANILAPVLIKLLDEGLGDLVIPGGSLVLSGIIAEQSPGVEEALAKNGMVLSGRKQIQDWVALLAKRASPPD